MLAHATAPVTAERVYPTMTLLAGSLLRKCAGACRLPSLSASGALKHAVAHFTLVSAELTATIVCQIGSLIIDRTMANAGASLGQFARSSGVKNSAPKPMLVNVVAGAVIAANLGSLMIQLAKHLTADAETGGEQLANT